MSATATATNKKKTQKAAEVIRVKFGNVNIGDETARIGITIPRDKLADEKAINLLVARRLLGTIVVAEGDVDPRQKNFLQDATASVEGAFDTRALRIGLKEFGSGLTFSLTNIDANELSQFAKKSGFLWIDDAQELEVEPDGEDEGDDE